MSGKYLVTAGCLQAAHWGSMVEIEIDGRPATVRIAGIEHWRTFTSLLLDHGSGTQYWKLFAHGFPCLVLPEEK